MKTILITGANGHLGKTVIEKLHAKGYTICATVGTGKVPDDLGWMTCEVRQVNLTDESQTRQYVHDILKHCPDLSAAVLLVGGFAMGTIQETDATLLDQQITLNFKTAYFIVRPLLEHFEKRGHGQFILVGARPAIDARAGKNMVAYSLSKALLFQLAELINEAGKGHQITATVLVPSIIDTAPNREAMPDADFSKWVKPLDIADTIAFVLSDAGKTLREPVLKLYNEA